MDLMQMDPTVSTAVDDAAAEPVMACRLPHWERNARWETPDRRLRASEETYELLREVAEDLSLPRPVRTMMEWEPGTGDNALQFIGDVSRYYGVSEDSMHLCEQQLLIQGFFAFLPITIRQQDPESVLAFLERPVDFFLSTDSFQRFPSLNYGVKVLKVAYGALAQDGTALIQIRYHDGSEYLSPRWSGFRSPDVPNTYRVSQFWELTRKAGFSPKRVVINPPSRSAFFFLRKEY